ncbi:hypothetical protein [Thalassotalea mangrovi]|uniref:Outer membrane protein beta-barrel domain-containing protein n=1 Tax=Thalassotalea mangrovi TaxID=2572245 RepID=A0A4U1BBB1_9GAMM|nr:hypothetical protein [Thalassotalea mangrovi]TKB47458.1 hypothetical protein E8M12_01325 [Thalassotalea mangrovi]
MKSLILPLTMLLGVGVVQAQTDTQPAQQDPVVEASPAEPMTADQQETEMSGNETPDGVEQSEQQQAPPTAKEKQEDSVFAYDDFGYGLGFGILYSGLGANVNVTKANDMKYASLGCLGHSSEGGLACGVGVGWIRTDLFDVDPFYADKHGVGIYVGAVGSEKSREPSRRFPDYDNEIVWGLAGSYHYFLNGIKNPGTNLGASFVIGNGNDDIEFGLLLQVGYQF